MKKTLLALFTSLLFSVPALAGDIYAYTAVSLGSAIGGKNLGDGNMPFWIEGGLKYKVDDKFSLNFGAFHRSNADRDQDGEYELNGLKFGIEFQGCLTCSK